MFDSFSSSNSQFNDGSSITTYEVSVSTIPTNNNLYLKLGGNVYPNLKEGGLDIYRIVDPSSNNISAQILLSDKYVTFNIGALYQEAGGSTNHIARMYVIGIDSGAGNDYDLYDLNNSAGYALLLSQIQLNIINLDSASIKVYINGNYYSTIPGNTSSVQNYLNIPGNVVDAASITLTTNSGLNLIEQSYDFLNCEMSFNNLQFYEYNSSPAYTNPGPSLFQINDPNASASALSFAGGADKNSAPVYNLVSECQNVDAARWVTSPASVLVYGGVFINSTQHATSAGDFSQSYLFFIQPPSTFPPYTDVNTLPT